VLPTIGRFRVSSDSSPSARSRSGSPFLEFHSAMPSPFPMAQDLLPSNEDRISHLEATIDDLSDVTKTMLQSILDKLGTPAPHILALSLILPMLEVKLFTPLSPIHPFTPSPTSRKKLVLKASLPAEFNGDRAKGKAFLTSCRTYIRLSPDAFPDDMTRIIWALSFMKADQASWWAQRELELEA